MKTNDNQRRFHALAGGGRAAVQAARLLLGLLLVFGLAPMGFAISLDLHFVVTDNWGNCTERVKGDATIKLASCGTGTKAMAVMYLHWNGEMSPVWSGNVGSAGVVVPIHFDRTVDANDIGTTRTGYWQVFEVADGPFGPDYTKVAEHPFIVTNLVDDKGHVDVNPCPIPIETRNYGEIINHTAGGDDWQWNGTFTGSCDVARSVQIIITLADGEELVFSQALPPMAGTSQQRQLSGKVCGGATIWEVYHGDDLLAAGTFDGGAATAQVQVPCPEPDPTEPTPDPEDESEGPNMPEEPPGQETPDLPDDEGGPLAPPTNPPNTNNGGESPVDPADPLADPDTESPELEELDTEQIKDKAADVLKAPEQMRSRFIDRLKALLQFDSPSVGRVMALNVGTFYDKQIRLDLTPYATAVAAGRGFLLWALVICFLYATIKAIRQTIS